MKTKEDFILPKDYCLDENPALAKAYKLLCSTQPVVLLVGGAGTGKSTFIKYIRKNFFKDTRKSCVVLSPTGIAATNVSGQTIHSFFHFPARDFANSEINKIRKNSLVDKAELIIIDEISQVESVMIDHIDYALRKWRMSSLPFGGVQILLTGDYFQLSPWIKWGGEKEKFLKANNYKSQFFFDAHVFSEVEVEPIVLEKIYRQNDRYFIDLLNTIRTCSDDNTVKAAIETLNKKCVLPNKKIPDDELFLTITNEKADKRNSEKLKEMEKSGAKIVTYKAEIKNFKNDDKDFMEKIIERIPTPEILELCVGAKVMITRNIYKDGTIPYLVNGDVGVVKELRANSVVVSVKGCDEEIFPASWDRFQYVWNEAKKSIEAEVVGSFLQIPLKLGWALTIHKSQGMTLDSAVIDAEESFAPGQVYVALSRCKTLGGVHLFKPLSMKDVFAEDDVKQFHTILSNLDSEI